MNKKHNLIITSSQLHTLLQDASSNILLLDLSSEQACRESTIPGAVHMPFEALVSGKPPHPAMLPSEKKFAKALADVGYDGTQHLVAFDDEYGLKAARFYWTLCMLADRDVMFSYLDGGRASWENSGNSLGMCAQAEPTEPLPLVWDLVSGPRATKKEIMASLADKTLFLWDTRTEEEYTGEQKHAKKRGHIPGAKHLEWNAALNQDGALKPAEEIRSMLDDFFKDQLENQPIVAYCQAHRRSAFAFMIGAYVGIDVLGYDGSWQEWGNVDGTPVETS